MTPGLHGLHLHETGVCDPDTDPPFASAGGHLNLTEAEHGDHVGDLGNISAAVDGSGVLQGTTDQFTLDDLMDEVGSAIVITAAEDTLEPAGDSSRDRIACGILATPVDLDGDGLTDSDEDGIGTDPAVADSDEDGLSDGEEVNTYGTDPNLADGDGLGDGEEIIVSGTDPSLYDTDEDGVPDGVNLP